MKLIPFYFLAAFVSCHAFYFVDNKTKEGSLDPQFIQAISETFGVSIFIETGTYNGQTTLNAAPFFQEIYSIELSSELYKACLAKTHQCNNIALYNGDSSILLPQIIDKNRNKTILFWLDAHFSGEGTARANQNDRDPNSFTAVRGELAAIASTGHQKCVILIDDIRGFGSMINDTEFLGCWAYPSIQEVCSLCHLINPHFAFALLGDTLLAYDNTVFNPSLSDGVKALTLSRLYDGKNLTEDELIDIEHIIMSKTTPQEKQFITALYNRMTNCKDPLFHHDLWYGLIAMETCKWQDAFNALSKVPQRTEHLNRSAQKVSIIRHYSPARITRYLDITLSKLRN